MEVALNTPQQIFLVFFAIFWGTSSGAWPRWKMFHWPLFYYSRQVRCRILLSIVLLNVVPLLYFVLIMYLLRGNVQDDPFSTLYSAYYYVLPVVLPAFAVFGFYRFWIGIVELWPLRFYYESDYKMRQALTNHHMAGVEPTIYSLKLRNWTRWWNLSFGVVYVGVPTGLLFGVRCLFWPPA